MAKRPTLDFVLKSLQQALPIIEEQAVYRTTIHSDQGWHYQHPAWVNALKKQRIFQSMSRKGTCANNAAMENFFGLLKPERYHGEASVPLRRIKEANRPLHRLLQQRTHQTKIGRYEPGAIPDTYQPISCIKKL